MNMWSSKLAFKGETLARSTPHLVPSLHQIDHILKLIDCRFVAHLTYLVRDIGSHLTIFLTFAVDLYMHFFC
jgi:hypothetical protein